jgi:hypothetical protein
MTPIKAVGCVAFGALLAVAALYPTLKETRREQRWGLLMSPEDVKTTCGKPQTDDNFKLTYVYGDSRVDLQFFGWNHRMFLQRVDWQSSRSAGTIYQVSRDQISENVRGGYLPACLDQAAK